MKATFRFITFRFPAALTPKQEAILKDELDGARNDLRNKFLKGMSAGWRGYIPGMKEAGALLASQIPKFVLIEQRGPQEWAFGWCLKLPRASLDISKLNKAYTDMYEKASSKAFADALDSGKLIAHWEKNLFPANCGAVGEGLGVRPECVVVDEEREIAA